MKWSKLPWGWIIAMVYVTSMPLILGVAAQGDRAPVAFKALTSQTAAAWIQAVGSVAAIFAAIALQDRERRAAEKESLADQIEAINALSQACASTVVRIHRRAVANELDGNRIHYLLDDISADEAALAKIDLISVHGGDAVILVSRLHQIVRTVKRRLKYQRVNFRNRLAMDPTTFEQPMIEVLQVRHEIDLLRQSRTGRSMLTDVARGRGK
jgi:hypothetical protein